MTKVNTLLRTLSHLKPIQAVYQVRNRVLPKKPLKAYSLNVGKTQTLSFFKAEPIAEFLHAEGDNYQFTFLNLEKTYTEKVNWNDQSHGKLWNYNLQYLDFLKQDSVDLNTKITLVKDLYSELWNVSLPLEPYPVSLRIMNMIRFLLSNDIQDSEKIKLQEFVLAELDYLSKNLEYHLLGNHLLENAFAIFMGGEYFREDSFKSLGEKLLRRELDEQILNDGAHFELSPMYHKIIFFRVLELLGYQPQESDLYHFVREKALKMFGWLKQMTFSDGSIPHFNDSIDGIAYSSQELFSIAKDLDLSLPKDNKLSASGYRKLTFGSGELIADLYGIGPSYQPGHAHADSLSFVFQVAGKPFIVDPAISTYNISPRREWERSTAAHNTVTVNNENTAEVWSGFRVGRRPKVKISKDTENSFEATLNYEGFCHTRLFFIEGNSLVIQDTLRGEKQQAIAKFYLHPEVKIVNQSKQSILFSNGVEILTESSVEIKTSDYMYNVGYNKQILSTCWEVEFSYTSSYTFLLNQ